jgi:lipopolysaccharide transport system ATP-binding protein
MSDTAIQISGLGKQFRIGAERNRHRTLGEKVTRAMSEPFRRMGRIIRGEVVGAVDLTEHFWALRDVNLEIKRGELVGIIGRNGSGKSTLLKVISRITEPTRGEVRIAGRVGSLLEVGTGFHPELTGGENIYLNGAILGMRKAEIKRKFDEIVAFAEIAKFIDTPVKHYSTGMYLRLAFSVAAHLEPEILVVDEVLAVGDAGFQRKCLNKMEDVGNQGRTVIFVSHNMPAITRLCDRAILLDEGRVIKDGNSHGIVSTYLSSGVATTAEREWTDLSRAPGTEVVRLRAVRVRGQNGNVAETVDIREPVALEMEYEILRNGCRLIPHFSVHNEEGLQIFSAVDTDPKWRGKARPAGRYVSTGWIPGNLLSEGTLIIGAAANTLNPNMLQFWARDAVAFHVIDSFEGDAARGEFASNLDGVVRPILEWETTYSPNGYQTAAVAAEERLSD